jgi:hypothetical protein
MSITPTFPNAGVELSDSPGEVTMDGTSKLFTADFVLVDVCELFKE